MSIRLRITVVMNLLVAVLAGQAFAEQIIKGQVLGGGAPIANSTVTLWQASSGAPKQLAQTKTNADGRFEMNSPGPSGDTSLYLVATGGVPKSGGGDNPAIALLTVLGSKPPATVTINEFTTVASVWTNNQFLNGTALQGHALGLKIAAGNVPNFVDLQSGGWGATIQDPLNSTQTPTMANFRNTGRCACYLRHEGSRGCDVRQAFCGRKRAKGKHTHRHTDRGGGDCTLSLVSAEARV